jgi:hypothetical protein
MSSTKPEREEATKQAACTECGHMQRWATLPCESCRSRKVYSVFYLEREHGTNWREKLLASGEEQGRPSATQAPPRRQR